MTTSWVFSKKYGMKFKVQDNWILYSEEENSEEWASDAFDTEEELNAFLNEMKEMFNVTFEVKLIKGELPMTVIAVKQAHVNALARKCTCT